MNTNDKRAAALMLTASVIFGGLLAARALAAPNCVQQDNPLEWNCATDPPQIVAEDQTPLSITFEWADDGYGIGSWRLNPETPWTATFVCSGRESGIFNVWVSRLTEETYPTPRLNTTVEYQQIFCQAERLNVWGSVARFLCYGSWSTGHSCRDDLWNGYEVIEQQ